MEIFCFFIGIFFEHSLNLAFLLLFLALLFITPRVQLPIHFLLGILLAWVHTLFISPQGFPPPSEVKTVLLQGKIASIPLKMPYKTQFTFAVDRLNGQPAKGLIQLAWYHKPARLKMGQHWQFRAKIKQPHNFQNPGSFDYVNSLVAKHIYWIGTIQANNSQLLSNPTSWLQGLSLREQLAKQILKLAPDQKTAGIIEALSLNLTAEISQEEWDLFRRTGTTHLFGISGEHIALISGLSGFLIRWLWSRSTRCCLWIPARVVGSLGGFVLALNYAFLAGFAPPVQRALIGCFFYTLYSLGKQGFTIWQIWRYALFGVLCLEPHVILMQGFYFSFLAVACLLLTQQRWQLKGYQGKLALQASCLIGLMPLTLYWFSYGSFNGFIANLFAIPLVGLCIVPLSLMTLCFCTYQFSWILMTPLAWLIALLFRGLDWVEHLEVMNLNWPLTQPLFVCALLGALLLWVLVPVKPFKYLAWLWLFLPFFPLHRYIAPGEALIDILDVGQGLAVVVQTEHHNLLYDTGDHFFQGNDLGTMVVLPFYQVSGIKKVDKIVISHPDKDHRGGLKSIEAGIKVQELIVNDPASYDHGVNCHRYPSWYWDGVSFRFLAIHKEFKDKNNNSCILQISTKQAKILFTGDIEREGEDYLVRTYGQDLASQILLVPHHGSKTSSSYRFLLEVAPRFALASLGLNNRFHFPHAKTLNSMNSLGISFISTDVCGMISVRLPAEGVMKQPLCYNV